MPNSKKANYLGQGQESSNWCYQHFGGEHSPFAPFGSCPFPEQNTKCVCHLKSQNQNLSDIEKKVVRFP